MSIAGTLRERLVEVAAATEPPLGGSGPDSHSLGIPRQRQVGDNWCWAAVSVGIRNFQQPASPLSQCALVKKQLNHDHADCCSLPPPQKCDVQQALQRALKSAGVPVDTPFKGTLSFADLAAQLLANKPICCAIRWSKGSFHFVQVDGFRTGSRGNEVFVNDPLNTGGWVLYDELVSSYNSSGKWKWTYRVL